jgi:hypothetical protein
MDGRQRLSSLKDFYSNNFKLEGLQYWPELTGRTYSTLPSKVKDGIDRRYISSIILLKETARDEEQAALLKKMVFERLNSGGVELSGQETRNAVFDGPLNQLCLRLSLQPDFRSLWALPSELPSDPSLEDDDSEEALTSKAGRKLFQEMGDVELVLRFFAFRQIRHFPQGLNKISEFLDRFLREGNRFPQSLLGEYETLFTTTIKFVRQLLGDTAFARGPTTRRPMKVVFDAVMYVASQHAGTRTEAVLLSRRVLLREELARMYRDNGSLFAGRKTNSVDVERRNQLVHNVFEHVVASSA